MALRIRKTRLIVPEDIRLMKRNRGVSECPLTRCMDLIGAAWAPHIIWYLSDGPRRFGELRYDIPAISARVLSQRLRELGELGVVSRTLVDTRPPRTEYELTRLGLELVPVVNAIANMGRKLAKRASG